MIDWCVNHFSTHSPVSSKHPPLSSHPFPLSRSSSPLFPFLITFTQPSDFPGLSLLPLCTRVSFPSLRPSLLPAPPDMVDSAHLFPHLQRPPLLAPKLSGSLLSVPSASSSGSASTGTRSPTCLHACRLGAVTGAYVFHAVNGS